MRNSITHVYTLPEHAQFLQNLQNSEIFTIYFFFLRHANVPFLFRIAIDHFSHIIPNNVTRTRPENSLQRIEKLILKTLSLRQNPLKR